MKKFKISNHVALTFCLLAASIVFACCSFIPYGPEEGTGILHGISTGLFTGVVLLLINGVKKEETRTLKAKQAALKKISDALSGLYHIYGVVYHKTYHGKKEAMGIAKYHDTLMDAYHNCKANRSAIAAAVADAQFMDMIPSSQHQIQLSICSEKLNSELHEIYTRLDNVDVSKAAFSDIDEIRESFCVFTDMTENCINWMSELLISIDDQLEIIDRSLFG